MQRRTLLGWGLAGGAALSLAGLGAAWMHESAWRDGRLQPAGRRVMSGVARGVLDGSLPEAPALQAQVVDAHLERLERLLRALPPHTQAEVADLLALIAMPPLRSTLVGLSADWSLATPGQLQSALQSMRASTWSLRRQIYAALRELTHGAYFADASTWTLLHYPGPKAIG